MKNLTKKIAAILSIAIVAPLILTACGQEATGLEGEIKIDGSSTVFPITEAVAEEFIAINPDMQIPVGVSGSGGGFKKFIVGEIDIADASRPIKDEEAQAAKDAGIEFLELKVAFDGLSVLVNKDNTWVNNLTTDQLKMIWEPGSKVKTWKDIDPSWPAENIKFYAPGTDSGTFEYFTEEIMGEAGAIRQDYTGSEDDNVLVQGIAGDKNAIGFFGFAYYVENKDKLKVVKVNDVEPTSATIEDGSYSPLSRPLYIYVNKAALEKEEVKEFVKFYLENASVLATEVGYIQMPEKDYNDQLELLK